MPTTANPLPASVILLALGEGRHYPCAPMQSAFLPDGVDATTGTFLRVPARVIHDFENRTTRRAGVLNVFIPGGLETNMPGIVEWFRSHPPS